MDSADEGYNIIGSELPVTLLITFKTMGHEEETKISIDKFKKLTSDKNGSDEEIQEIINNIYRLSNLVYDLIEE